MNMMEFLKELEIYTKYFSPEMMEFYNQLKENNSKSILTENGKKILFCMQENCGPYLNIYSSKQLGELLFMSPRSISGSMKKLVNEGYVEKKSNTPVTYGLTELGKNFKIDKD